MKSQFLVPITALALCTLAPLAAAQHEHHQAPPAAAPVAAPAAAAVANPVPPPRPSPMAMARISLGDAYVRVVYSRPGKKGRDNIFGSKESKALVPYGEVWRTGANEATEITVSKDVMIGGQRLAAGTYSVFTVPGPERWSLRFNSALGLWGSGGYDAAKDVLTLDLPAKTLADEVELFTIELVKAEAGADLVLKWIKTEVRVDVKAGA